MNTANPLMNQVDSSSFFYSKFQSYSFDLTDEQWNLIEPLLIPSQTVPHPGRPPVPLRRVLDGVLWKLRTAASWDELPSNYPSHQTCYRYYRRWMHSGILDAVLRLLMRHLQQSGVPLESALLDGDIEILDARHGAVLVFNKHLQGTWQASTAQLLLQVFHSKSRKLGRVKGRLSPTLP